MDHQYILATSLCMKYGSVIVLVAFALNLLLSGIFHKSIQGDILFSRFKVDWDTSWIRHFGHHFWYAKKLNEDIFSITHTKKVRILHNYLVFKLLHVCTVLWLTVCLNISYQFLYVTVTMSCNICGLCRSIFI